MVQKQSISKGKIVNFIVLETLVNCSNSNYLIFSKHLKGKKAFLPPFRLQRQNSLLIF
uniref:Uncharacterized protein n=1 Tax=Nelumbo nucifera TaxID=4432 RepID=A0A822YAJ3_NELNU|nr:TPA_asm: hypothetical protein HUJ06_030591 [Nelumbo nucifera]